MKKKELIDLKGKTLKDLRKLSAERISEAKKIKMRQIGGKEKNLKSYRNARRDIAQILTLVREKEILEKLKAKSEELKTEK